MNSSAVYSGAGYLLFSDGSSLFAQAFDPAHLQKIAERFMVAERAGRASTYKSLVSASLSGAIAFAETLSPRGSLTWFHRDGKTLGSMGPLGYYTDFRLSPTDDALAASRLDDKTGGPRGEGYRPVPRQYELDRAHGRHPERHTHLLARWRDSRVQDQSRHSNV
jgi:hypothetical protein